MLDMFVAATCSITGEYLQVLSLLVIILPLPWSQSVKYLVLRNLNTGAPALFYILMFHRDSLMEGFRWFATCWRRKRVHPTTREILPSSAPTSGRTNIGWIGYSWNLIFKIFDNKINLDNKFFNFFWNNKNFGGEIGWKKNSLKFIFYFGWNFLDKIYLL